MSAGKPRIVIAEPHAPVAAALKKFLDGWADVQVVQYADEAVQLVRARPPEVLIAAVHERFDGELLTAVVRKLSSETAIVLAYPAEEFESAPDRAKQAGADGFLVGPFKKHQVLGMVQAVSRLHVLAVQLKALEAKFDELKRTVKPPAKKARPPTGLNAHDDVFFKKYILLEVKRGRRYQYPVALLVVGFDKLDEQLGDSAPDFQRDAVRQESLEVLSALLRDIDVAMPFAGDKFLLFLPHTPLRGATVVAGRVVEKLSRLEALPGGTASVGVACFEPRPNSKEKDQPQVSFGSLVREATAALKRAQAAGGARFEAPVQDKPKKNRISLA